MTNKITFKQNLDWFTKREYILEDNSVLVSTKGILKSNKNSVKYRDILPEVIESKDLHVKSLIGLILSLIAASFFMYLYLFPTPEKPNEFWTLALIFVVFAIYSLIVFNKKSFSMSYFKLHSGGVLAFNRNSPNKQSVQEFLNILTSEANKIKLQGGLTESQKLAQYLGYLNFLYNDGVLTEEEHKVISNRLTNTSKSAAVVSIVKT
jgi:hypothetical protein